MKENSSAVAVPLGLSMTAVLKIAAPILTDHRPYEFLNP